MLAESPRRYITEIWSALRSLRPAVVQQAETYRTEAANLRALGDEVPSGSALFENSELAVFREAHAAILEAMAAPAVLRGLFMAWICVAGAAALEHFLR